MSEHYERQRQAAKEKRKIFVYEAGCPPECKRDGKGAAVRRFDKVGRNDQCPCGSGAKMLRNVPGLLRDHESPQARVTEAERRALVSATAMVALLIPAANYVLVWWIAIPASVYGIYLLIETCRLLRK